MNAKFLSFIKNYFLIITLLFNIFANIFYVENVKAATNLVKNNSFESDIERYWGNWVSENSSRNYELYRAYDAPMGNGSYSVAIDAHGNPADAFTSIFSSKVDTNSFNLDANKNYYLIFYAKASQNMSLITYLQRADTFAQNSSFEARVIGTTWQKYIINVHPNVSGKAVLAFVHGDMPDGSTLFLDGVELVENNLKLYTTEIKAYVGDQNKYIKISNIGIFRESDIEIELPYYNNLNKQIETLRVHPKNMTAYGVYFDIPQGTFAGIGRVYVQGNYLGVFNYNILVRITDFHPALIRLDQDLIIRGSGFSPLENNTFLIVDYINAENKKEKLWLNPITMDTALSQMSFRLPAGVVPGSMYVQTSFIATNEKERINKSNALSYQLKPIVYSTEWSKRGYEQVGDKLKIRGLGFGRAPYVNFYNDNNVKVEVIRAKFLELGDTELVEVATTKKINDFTITITAGGIESDKSENLNYLAKPKLSSIYTKYHRVIYDSNEKIPAGKVGDEITIYGLGFKPNNASSSVSVEFQGYNRRINSLVDSSKIDKYGKSLKVIIPEGAQNGYIGVRVNGEISNYRPIEIIPTIITVNPDPIIPGQDIIITANGVGDNINLTKINFKLKGKEIITKTPYAIDMSSGNAVIYVKAPLALSNKYNSLVLQYDRWQNNGEAVLNVRPHISSASINLDNKILSIKGYGFSINAKENVITYMYADEDHTVISPKVKMLGVYPTEEGQEIRVKILDNYHYGNINVKVGEFTSETVQFGPTKIANIARRVEYVEANNAVMGVLYITGYNFGANGKVMVGDQEAQIHYRTDFFIIAVVPQEHINDNPVIVTRE